MAVRIAINGFGRIGRMVFRAMYNKGLIGADKNYNLVAIALRDIDADYRAYQLKYDTTQGTFECDIQTEKSSPDQEKNDVMVVNGDKVRFVKASSTPAGLPWQELGIDYVIEATGAYTHIDQLKGHLEAGAKKVILTAPGKGGVKTFVMGVNEEEYDPATHDIISNASCTTNCLAPIVHVLLKEGVGISSGLMTTIHAYTASQKPIDGKSLKDWRGGRAAAQNIIPSTTGAAKAVSEVLPETKDVLTGMSFRVPVPTGSVIDFTFHTTRDSSVEEIDSYMKKAAFTYLHDILEYCSDEIVSSDIIHNSRSSIYDSLATRKNNLPDAKRHFKIISWYDNEWGYSNRVVDLLVYIIKADFSFNN